MTKEEVKSIVIEYATRYEWYDLEICFETMPLHNTKSLAVCDFNAKKVIFFTGQLENKFPSEICKAVKHENRHVEQMVYLLKYINSPGFIDLLKYLQSGEYQSREIEVDAREHESFLLNNKTDFEWLDELAAKFI